MPSYPLTFPTNVFPAKVKVRRPFANTRFDNPLQLSSQVQQRNAKRYEIDITLQPMLAAEAGAWTQFLEDLAGGVGTFNFNLTPHIPGLSPAPGVRVFRLADNKHEFDSELSVTFGFAFSAIEVV